MTRLLDPGDAAVAALLERAVIHVVPEMNPDGVALGHTRANAAGANLNRVVVVFAGRRAQSRGTRGARPDGGDRRRLRDGLPRRRGAALQLPRRPRSRSRRARTGSTTCSPASSTRGTPRPPTTSSAIPIPAARRRRPTCGLAWNWIAERFDCLSVLLEQPFKDTAWRQAAARDWTPERAVAFGESFPAALLGVVERLR